ncbi:MAG TPA: hypothetical protein VIL30_23400, partial [Ramlibacter sp.]
MSAARWRNAMNASATAAVPPTRAPLRVVEADDPYGNTTGPRWLAFLSHHISPHHIVMMIALLVFPFVASPFLTFQVAAQALALGLVGLSLTFLAGYGG